MLYLQHERYKSSNKYQKEIGCAALIYNHVLLFLFYYFPEFLGQQFFNSTISYGIVFGFLLILIIFIVTLVYVFLSNKYLEPEIKKITL